MGITQQIGRYQQGEGPLRPLAYQYLDHAGTPIDIAADHTHATWVVRDPAGVETTHPATIIGDDSGTVEVAWTPAMTDQTGTWQGIVWLWPGPVASDTLRWTVIDGPGPGATPP